MSLKSVINQKLSTVDKHIDSVIRKPVGLKNKTYEFLQGLLNKNIGSNQHGFDGYNTIIGYLSNPYLNEDTDPWFMLDKDKMLYDNYINYINNVFFHGTMTSPRFNNNDNIYYNNFINNVGVIRSYDVNNLFNESSIYTNPNGENDTRLGVLNNFYLKQNLSYKLIDREKSSVITNKIYDKFSLLGEYGAKNESSYPISGSVMPQSLITDDIIPWSTSDNMYYNKDVIKGSSGLFGIVSDMLASSNKDNTRGVSNTFTYHPFGNYYSLSYSLGLIEASGSKTSEFIAKSIYGLDLLSDYTPSILFEDINSTAIKGLTRKKYFASVGSRGTNYIDMMTGLDVSFISDAESDNNLVRIELNDPGNDNFSTYNTYLMYAEGEGNKVANENSGIITIDNGTSVSNYEIYNSNNVKNKIDIIRYTNEHFKKNKIKTILGRFHTDSFNNPNEAKLKKDQTSSSVSQYGMSHGRNLLKKDHKNSEVNGFHDPYCRVWTYHKQYSKYSDLIRPLSDDVLKKVDTILKETTQSRRDDLNKYGVKNSKTNLLNIHPEISDGLYKCMFSIENLAWKDDELLENYSKGPEGGRIMWFPPYGLTFNENINTNWSSNQFIGRGEKIYSYIDTERKGNLSFQLLIDYPSILDCNIKADDTTGDVDDVNSKEQSILRFFAGTDVFDVIANDEKVIEDKQIDGGKKDDKSKTINKNIEFTYYPKNEDSNSFIKDLGNSESFYCSYNSFFEIEDIKNDEIRKENSEIVKKLLQEYSVKNVVITQIFVDNKIVKDFKKTLKKKLKNNNIKVNVNNNIGNDRQRLEVKIELDQEKNENVSDNGFIGLSGINMFDNITYSNIFNTDRSSNLSSLAKKAMENIDEYDLKLKRIELQQKKQEQSDNKEKYNEFEFFSKTDNLVRNKISQKIRFFDPAFHSITPEGFNERLTFLHQCTRQGKTKSLSDTKYNYSNLSFGTPPICVLRIGDFFNTKIVIESINITYDDTMWDLNDEGIGVMPMYAKIDINFTFIGGSSIKEPISQLQNAVSFNYYANTLVYDKNSIVEKNKEQK